jgi:hypothetical protein
MTLLSARDERKEASLALLGRIFHLFPGLLHVLAGPSPGVATRQRHGKGKRDGEQCGKRLHGGTPSALSALQPIAGFRVPHVSQDAKKLPEGSFQG